MVFDIRESLNGNICFVETKLFDAWELSDLLWLAFGWANNSYIGCYNGYENCVIFHKEYR